jgi:[protein-PII] uridylyltransferase
VSFHSDWANERCTLTLKEMHRVSKQDPSNWGDTLKALKKDQSLQTQAIIRKKLYDTRGFSKEKLKKTEKGKILKKILDIKTEDDLTVAAFRSQMVSHLIPNFTKVIGLVQHDQYHRYSVNAHLLQAVREVRRIYTYPKLLGKLEFFGEKLKISDWNILRWTALYHDIAKGRKGDHSKKGRELTLKDLKAFGFSKNFAHEVAWLVENHLILSTAAFRKNPQSPKTWEYLFSRGVRGPRLYRLAIFTVIDILATNPDAWNSWKENLLCEMVDTLRNPSPAKHYDFTQKLKRQSLKVPDAFLNDLDSSLIDAFSHNVLLKDFRQILKGEELNPLVMKDRRNRVWMRFHKKKDQAGLVLEFTQKLTSLGCNIRQAMIYTDKKMGVYDWFCVKTNKSLPVLRKRLQVKGVETVKEYKTPFSQIDLVSWDEEEWVYSFRAGDKKGLLLTAIQALHNEGFQISWAKVHTWGRQIDDIFGVEPMEGKNPEDILKKLQKELVVKDLEIL